MLFQGEDGQSPCWIILCISFFQVIRLTRHLVLLSEFSFGVILEDIVWAPEKVNLETSQDPLNRFLPVTRPFSTCEKLGSLLVFYTSGWHLNNDFRVGPQGELIPDGLVASQTTLLRILFDMTLRRVR